MLLNNKYHYYFITTYLFELWKYIDFEKKRLKVQTFKYSKLKLKGEYSWGLDFSLNIGALYSRITYELNRVPIILILQSWTTSNSFNFLDNYLKMIVSKKVRYFKTKFKVQRTLLYDLN